MMPNFGSTQLTDRAEVNFGYAAPDVILSGEAAGAQFAGCRKRPEAVPGRQGGIRRNENRKTAIVLQWKGDV